MCLEKKIEELTIAINRLTVAMSGSNESVNTIAAPTPEVQSTPAPVPTATETSIPAPPPVPETPAPTQPEPAVAGNTPFSNTQELVAYVMDKYKQLGPQKGAEIQQVLVGLGYSNINDVKPEHYADFHQKVEAL